jgi:hypothetical protein
MRRTILAPGPLRPLPADIREAFPEMDFRQKDGSFVTVPWNENGRRLYYWVLMTGQDIAEITSEEWCAIHRGEMPAPLTVEEWTAQHCSPENYAEMYPDGKLTPGKRH